MAVYTRNGSPLMRRVDGGVVPLRQAVDRLFQDSFLLDRPF